MSNVIFRLIIFSLLFNVSTGIMLEAIPSFVTSQNDGSISGEGGITYVANESGYFTTTLGDQVNPSGSMEDKSDAIDRLLDTIGIGYIKKFLEVINHYLYGFVVLLDNIIGGYLPEGLHAILFAPVVGLFNVVITIGYIIGGYSLWTGRGIRTVR